MGWRVMRKPKKAADKANGRRVGVNKGFEVTKRAKVVKPAKRLALPKTKLRAVRDIILEVSGLSPYERRITELLKVQREKRALRCEAPSGELPACQEEA